MIPGLASAAALTPGVLGRVLGYDWTPLTALEAGASITQTETRTFEKTAGNADWNDWVYSSETITGDQAVRFRWDGGANQAMIGLIDAVPLAGPGNDWAQLDYGFYMAGSSFSAASGVLDFGTNGAMSNTVEWEVRYTGTTVALYRNGAATGKSWATTGGRTFRVAAIFNEASGGIVRDLKHLAV
jgi:hypothetical protein